MGKLFCIMGKSATGKDHIYQAVLDHLELHLRPLVLYTTRPKREGEENGREYFFVDAPQMKKLRESGKIIEERVYQTVHGPWYYFTADDEQIDLEAHDYLAIETLESYAQLRKYFGAERIVPLYIDVDDGVRLERAIRREKKQAEPRYVELCRRFVADAEDFSEEKLAAAGVEKRFMNNDDLETVITNVVFYIKENMLY